jgi:hypothetical protein
VSEHLQIHLMTSKKNWMKSEEEREVEVWRHQRRSIKFQFFSLIIIIALFRCGTQIFLVKSIIYLSSNWYARRWESERGNS